MLFFRFVIDYVIDNEAGFYFINQFAALANKLFWILTNEQEFLLLNLLEYLYNGSASEVGLYFYFTYYIIDRIGIQIILELHVLAFRLFDQTAFFHLFCSAIF